MSSWETPVISGVIAVLTMLFAYLKSRDGLRFETIEAELARYKLEAQVCHDDQIITKSHLSHLEAAKCALELQMSKMMENELNKARNEVMELKSKAVLATAESAAKVLLEAAAVIKPLAPAQVTIVNAEPIPVTETHEGK